MIQNQKALHPKTKVCPQCGGKVSAKAKFCTYCGSKIIVKTIEFPKITESLEDRQQKEIVLSHLRSFLNFNHNPNLEDIKQTFNLVDNLFLKIEEVYEILVLLLEHPFKIIREKAAFLIVQKEKGLQKLLDILVGDIFWLKATAVHILGRIKNKQAIPSLINLLGKTQDFWLKQEIIFALGEIGDIQAFNTLIRALNFSEPELICAAADSLKALADPAAIQYLLPKIDDHNPQVVLKVKEAVQSFGKKAVSPLVKLLSDFRSPDKIKQKALEILKEIPDSMAVPLLINFINQNSSFVVPVIKIMGAWRFKEFIPVLEKMENSNQRDWRLEAQVALKQIKEHL
ncbi:MAG: HEAT repeat domain-containing protein [Candidatus Margulisbacteria bacterium]|nr:HEAT repeat domain-containing protein [Candidatus Margulisiibacteriota bacterium]